MAPVSRRRVTAAADRGGGLKKLASGENGKVLAGEVGGRSRKGSTVIFFNCPSMGKRVGRERKEETEFD